MTEAPSVPEEDVNPPSAGVPMLETRGLARRFAMHGPARTHSVRAALVVGDEVLERVRLSHRPRAGPRELSVAGARRLEFARALALRPRLLLLDEVMAGLRGSEIEPSLALIHALRGEGMTIVAVEHVMKAILSISDEILVLHHGRVLTLGRPHDVLSDERGIGAYLGHRYAHRAER